VAGEARVHGVDLLAEADEADALVAMLDEVFGGESGAAFVFDENSVNVRVRDGPGHRSIDGDHGSGVKLGIAEAGAAVACGDNDDAVDMAAEQIACGFGLNVCALVGGGDE